MNEEERRVYVQLIEGFVGKLDGIEGLSTEALKQLYRFIVSIK